MYRANLTEWGKTINTRTGFIPYVITALVFLLSCRTATSPTVFVEETPDISTGLVAHYLMAGNGVHSGGHGFSGLNQGGVSTSDHLGRPNSALSFNGYSSYVLCGDILDSVFAKPVATFTVAGWARTIRDGTQSGGGGLMIGKNGGGDDGPYEWNVTHSDGNIDAFVMFDTLAASYERISSPVGVGNWFHFALVFDGTRFAGSRMDLYINGLLARVMTKALAGTSGTGTMNSSQNLTIGAGHAARNPQVPNNCYDGSLSDIRIYNRALTAPEILAVYASE